MVTKLYVTSPELIHLITGNLCSWTVFTHFPSPPPTTLLATTNLFPISTSLFLSLFIEFIGVNWFTTIQVSGVQHYNASSVHCTVCSPPQVRSPSGSTFPVPLPPHPGQPPYCCTFVHAFGFLDSTYK